MRRFVTLLLVLAPFLNGLAAAFEPAAHGASCAHHAGACAGHCPPKKPSAAAKPCHSEAGSQPELRAACGARETDARLPAVDPAVIPSLDFALARLSASHERGVPSIAPERCDAPATRPPRTIQS